MKYAIKKKKKKKKFKLKRKGNGSRIYQQIPGRDKPANPENPIYGN